MRVVIDPDAGEPLDQPMANATARENVEKALMNGDAFDWSRWMAESDLVIAVRTGNGTMVRPTIKGGPIDQPPGEAPGYRQTAFESAGTGASIRRTIPATDPQDQRPAHEQ